VVTGQHSQRIGANFVGGVAVGGDAVGAHDNGVQFFGFQNVAGHIVGQNFVGDAFLRQFPGGQAGALQVGPGFVHVDPFDFAFRVGGPNDAQGGSVSRGGQGPGVAVGEDNGVFREETRPRIANGMARRNVFRVDGQGFLFESDGDILRGGIFIDTGHAVQSPKQVDRRRPRRPQAHSGLFQMGD
jgi:hypothetical protein